MHDAVGHRPKKHAPDFAQTACTHDDSGTTALVRLVYDRLHERTRNDIKLILYPCPVEQASGATQRDFSLLPVVDIDLRLRDEAADVSGQDPRLDVEKVNGERHARLLQGAYVSRRASGVRGAVHGQQDGKRAPRCGKGTL